MTCTSCDLHAGATSPCLMGIGDDTSSVMIITDSPSYFEDVKGEIYTGSLYGWLYRELYAVGIDMEQCFLTKAVKCFTSGDKPTTAQLKACKQNLWDELRRVKPRFILALGATSLNMLTGTVNISKRRGKMYTIDVDGHEVKCLSTYNPVVAVKQPNECEIFRADLYYFGRMVEDKWTAPTDFNYEIVDTEVKLLDAAYNISMARERAYDIETTSLKDKDNGDILMVAIAIPNKVYVFPLEYLDIVPDYDTYTLVTCLGKILEHKDDHINIAHNGKFDNGWLWDRGIHSHTDFDTFLASYVLNVNLPHDLKYLAKVHCGAMDYAIDASDVSKYTFEEVAEYCAMDAYYTLKLYYVMKKQLLKDQALARIFKYIMMPGSNVLEKIERRGAYVDLYRLRDVRVEYRKLAEEKRLEIIRITGADPETNFNSTKQLQELLFKKLKLKPIKETKTGYAVDKETLKRLAEVHEVPQIILDYRMYDKTISTFLDPWEERLLTEQKYGRATRLYAGYNIARETKDNGAESGTRTGRLSSSDPNLQQVTKDKNVRSLICAPTGKVFVEADMSQIELRIAAFEANEETMKDIYRHAGDIHLETGVQVSGIPKATLLSDKTLLKKIRSRAKAVNFGFLYGMWWKSFKQYAFVSYGVKYTDEEAQQAREAYLKKYSALTKWHERQRIKVKRDKYIRSAIGRIRHLPNIDSPDEGLRSEAERQAINTPVQSFASDITLLVMILADQQIPDDKAFMIGQVHDATLWECEEGYEETLGRTLKDIAERQVPEMLEKIFGVKLDLPLVLDVTAGDGWGIGEEIN